MPIGWFFEGLTDPAVGRETSQAVAGPTYAHDFLLTQEGVDLANLFPRIPQKRVRRRLVDLVRSLAEGKEGEQASV